MSNSNANNHLQELGSSNYKVVDGQPDIIGWPVKDAREQGLGTVQELIFDHDSQKVKYIVLDLDGNGLDLDPRGVLIPIGLAELDEEEDKVILPNASTIQLRELPLYEAGFLSTEIESRIKEIFSGIGLGSSAEAGNDLPERDYYSTDNLLKRRIKVSGNTVIGIFDNGFEAQNTVNKLKLSGFSDEQIDVCVKDTSHNDNDHSRISTFFNSLLENKEQASHFTEVAKKGTVVTVHANSQSDAQQAAEILDQHGSLNMAGEHSRTESDSDTVGEKDQQAVKARLYSTIIGRSVSSDMRLRSGGRPGGTNSGNGNGSQNTW